MAIQAYVTPRLIKWARERGGKTREETAKGLNVRADRISDWEEGRQLPTFRQAQELAAQLHVPFGYLFLEAPPVDELPVPDRRTIAGQPARAASPELIDAVEDALAKQSWLRDYRRQAGFGTLKFVGRASVRDGVERVAADMRATIGLTDDMRRSARSASGYLSTLVEAVEATGVVVMRNGVVGNNTHRKLLVTEFRGFAISDPLAPLVFINASDAPSAQVFTLAHELAHIWLGVSGVSDPQPAVVTADALERFCNQVAAELLLPAAAFSDEWDPDRAALDNLAPVARKFWVSRPVVLRRAAELGHITQSEYSATYPAVAGPGTQQSGGGGDFYRTLVSRNSRSLTRTLLDALSRGDVLHREAAQLLNVGADRLERVALAAYEPGPTAGG